MPKMTTLDLEEIMKPRIMTCMNCGGDLHVIPVKIELPKGKFRIDTINICGKCTFKK
jgi:hypothetical protein